MRELTGQDVLVKAVHTLANGSPAEAVRVLKLRGLRPDVDALGEQVSRWMKGEIRTPADVALRALDALGAIRWDVYDAADEALQQAEELAARIEATRDQLDDLDPSEATTP